MVELCEMGGIPRAADVAGGVLYSFSTYVEITDEFHQQLHS